MVIGALGGERRNVSWLFYTFAFIILFFFQDGNFSTWTSATQRGSHNANNY